MVIAVYGNRCIIAHSTTNLVSPYHYSLFYHTYNVTYHLQVFSNIFTEKQMLKSLNNRRLLWILKQQYFIRSMQMAAHVLVCNALWGFITFRGI